MTASRNVTDFTLIATVLSLFALVSAMETPILGRQLKEVEDVNVLIDTDAGIDDAWALFVCLQAHRDPNVPFNIVGFTASHGNTGVENVTLNVAQVLHAAGEDTIPFFRGAHSALVFPITSDNFFGEDGFGDAGLPAVQPQLEAEHAVSAIIRLAEEYKDKGGLTILCLAPLTNLAMAVRLQPEIRNLLKAVYILGGNHQGTGNTQAAAEFNFYADAEAAHVVLKNLSPTPLHILPWETMDETKPSCAFRSDVLGQIESKAMTLLNKIEAVMVQYCDGGWYSVDALAASLIIRPEMALKQETFYASVELTGTLTRGMMVVDKRSAAIGGGQNPPNVILTTQTNLTLFEEFLVWGVTDVDDAGSHARVPLPSIPVMTLAMSYPGLRSAIHG